MAIHDQKKRIREKMHREASAKLTAPKSVLDPQQANKDMDEFMQTYAYEHVSITLNDY